tara:strand:+ start:307 stop:582 length:276 start_codon:yes stop_codon:yes gene_type:complete
MEAIIIALQGQAGGLVSMALAMMGGYTILVKHILPQHRRIVDQLLSTHESDRRVFESAVSTISKRIGRIEIEVDDIKEDVHSIAASVRREA